MAEKKTLQEKVEDQLNCSICLDTYTNPKLLQCFHVYCQGCLVKLVVRDQQGHLVLTCPICRQVTPIPANGVTGLPPAFHISTFLDLMAKHKNEEGLASLAEKNKEQQLCLEHVGKALELYCETCEELICSHCALKKGKHHSHNYSVLNDAFEKYKEEIIPSLEPMEKQLAAVSKALAQCDSYCDVVSGQQANVEADIHKTIGHLQKVVHEALEVRKTELINQLHQMTQEKIKGLAVKRNQVETTQAQLSSCISFIRESFKTTSSHGDVLGIKATITQRAKELTTKFQPDILETSFQDIVSLSSVVQDITAMCCNCVQLSASSLPDPSKCYITGKGPKVAVVGEKSNVILQAIDTERKTHMHLIKSLQSELMSKITGTRANCSVERRGESQYKISYQPTIKGRHQLHIEVEGRHIRRSPLNVTVTSPVAVDLSAPIHIIDDVDQPYSLAIDQGRHVAVVIEVGVPCISVFSSSGKKLYSFGRHGSDRGQFNKPHGVAVDGEGNIFVADTWNYRIQKFTEEGDFLYEVDCGKMRPHAIAYNTSNNKLYVTSGNSDCVHILTSDLTTSEVFGDTGSAKGKFKHPRGISFDSIGNVYVADRDNSRIQVFSAEGKFLRIVEKKTRLLNLPSGVAVDSHGVIYVSELNCVTVFDHNGHYMSSTAGFAGPIGLTLDDSGVLYVCDHDNNRVLMF